MSKEAVLVLENGRVFRGQSVGPTHESPGEVVFNTSLSGYQEILSDPSYAGQIVVMTAPRRLYEMLPMAALIGCLIGLGALASSSELTIMRAAGVSIGRIVWAVMKPMLVLMVAGLLIGEYVAPVTEAQAQAARSLAQGTGDAQSARHGLWHRQGDEFIHINTVQPNGLLYGVTRYRFDDQH